MRAMHFRWAGLCVCLFLATQIFQGLCLLVWLPPPDSVAAALGNRLHLLDVARRLAVLGGLLAMAVPYAVIALDRFARMPVASLLGLVFALFFLLLELLHRGLDLAIVSQEWAVQFAAATDAAQREALENRFRSWESATRGIYLPLLLSGLIAWTCYAIAAWNGDGERWSRLAAIAFAANAARVLARILVAYAGATWLSFTGGLHVYLVLTITIYGTLAVWLFRRAAGVKEGAPPAAPGAS